MLLKGVVLFSYRITDSKGRICSMPLFPVDSWETYEAAEIEAYRALKRIQERARQKGRRLTFVNAEKFEVFELD